MVSTAAFERLTPNEEKRLSMYIHEEVCTNCAKCIPTCPVRAIYVDRSRKHVTIDQELCVECGVCYRSGVCEHAGLVRPTLTWPRSIRAALSDPLIVNPETRIPGRGTEEMKTNEVTGRYRRGYLGIAVELGRPGVGASFVDIQKVACACARHGVHFCPQNPITTLMIDTSTGDINPEVLGERVLSGIVEFEAPLEDAPAILDTLREVSKELDTVFSLDVISLVEPDGSFPIFPLLEKAGLSPSPNGKNNMGLGRPAFDFFGDSAS
ncbi:MAG: indolepyruvate ferredoxin oxidoreductase subunit alpha [Anaerolineae bacterium]